MVLLQMEGDTPRDVADAACDSLPDSDWWTRSEAVGLNALTDDDHAPAAQVVMTTADSPPPQQLLQLFNPDDDGDT